jgi:endonuclease-3
MDFNAIIDKLEECYPNARCELDYTTPFELLVAVILSAQCTDKRVNKITEELFCVANTPKAILELSESELEKLIYTAGFYKNKSKAIRESARAILENYGGNVPDTMDELVKLSGVGRKTASVILSEGFKKAAFAVDTHILCVTKRLGIADGIDPLKTELTVRELLPEARLSRAHILLVFFGRYVCTARNPKCGECVISGECLFNAECRMLV